MSEASRHLLLSFPELEIATSGRDVVDALVQGVVCHVLTERGLSSIVSLDDVAQAILKLAGLSYESVELIAAFERLEKAGYLSFRNEAHKAFVVREEHYYALSASLDRRERKWEGVRNAWVQDVRARYQLPDADSAALWEGLETFTAFIVNSNAEEAAAFLYLTHKDGAEQFARVLEERAPQIADLVDKRLLPIAQVEYGRFFENPGPDRADYLLERLRASFFWHLLSIDPSASELVREHVTEKVLYLDTNVLFRLLGFHGPAAAYGPSTVIEIARQLGCRILVARETLDEFVRTLRGATRQLAAMPISRPLYQKIAAEHPSDEGEFLQAYYREVQSGRVKNIDGFERKYANVQAFVQDWGAEIDEEAALSEEERHEEEFLNQVSRLNQWSGQKHPEAVDHDVFMLRRLRQLRGALDHTPGRVRHWFLTYDRGLTKFSTRQAADEHLPVCMIASDWLQIARPFLPRTENYARSFIEMLRHPVLYGASDVVPFAHMAEALARLERYQELPEPVVAALVADEAFVRRIGSAERDDEVRELISVKAAQVTSSALAENQRLQRRLQQAAEERSALSESLSGTEGARTALEAALIQQREASARSFEAERRASEERLATARAELQATIDQRLLAVTAEHERGSAEQRQAMDALRAEASTRHRWLVYLAISSSVVVGAVVLVALRWPFLSATHLWILAGWLTVVLGCLLVIPTKRSTAATAAGIALAVLGGILGTLQVLATPSSVTILPANRADGGESASDARATPRSGVVPVPDTASRSRSDSLGKRER